MTDKFNPFLSLTWSGSVNTASRWIKLAAVSILATIAGCNWSAQDAPCQKTTRKFAELFNQKNFRGAVSLFQRDAMNSRLLKKMSNNLTYIHGVAGGIKSMQFINHEGNKIIYKTIHENTAMDVIFQVNQKCQLVSYLIKTHYPDSLPQMERNLTPLSLPFHNEWYVKWGGPNLDQNYHNAHRNMRGAFDFIKKDHGGRLFKNQGKTNQDYYAFGQEVIAPCLATVVKVIDGIEDNKIGRTNTRQTYGNAIVLQTENEEYLLLAHLKNQSILVKEGQLVNQGDLLAQCGNSGYSTKPHLHFAVQNVADLFHQTGATGYFDKILVNGSPGRDYSPVQGDLVRNWDLGN